MRKQTSIIFYALSSYVLLQFGWWSYLLIDLTEKINPVNGFLQKKALMILSEGFVFFAILIFGLYKIKASIKKELALGRRQQNFILAVTHELKTPLAGIKLYLQTIKKRDLDRAQQLDLLNKALKENTRLETLVENVLTVSRIDENSYFFVKEAVVIQSFIRETIGRYEIVDNLEFTINVEPNLIREIDRSAMSIILSNLIDNSIKYAGETPHIQISIRSNSDGLEWDFEDNGPGIDKEKIPQAFQKFVRLENEDTRKTKGTGLGLYIVSQFVKRQNGKISLSKSDDLGGLKVNMIL
ncbi:MAG: HAMP domain-containing sensor histidine kinase [Crocinitomicaceae bacterium]